MEVNDALKLAKEIQSMELHDAARKILRIYYEAKIEGVRELRKASTEPPKESAVE